MEMRLDERAHRVYCRTLRQRGIPPVSQLAAIGALASGATDIAGDVSQFVSEIHANKETLDDYVKAKSEEMFANAEDMMSQAKSFVENHKN
jgi:hypothetical protein